MHKRILSAAMATVMGLAFAFSHGTLAAEPTAPFAEFDLPAQALADSLRAVAVETQTSLLFDENGVTGKQAPALKGKVTVDEAVARLLVGSGLAPQRVDERTIVLAPEGAMPPTAATSTAGGEEIRVAQADEVASGAASSQQDAQEQGGGESSAGEIKLEEIVVTAQKRVERLQDVPVSLTVIGNQEIERRGLIGMEDYLRSIPGVNQIDNGPLSNAIVIRGINTSPESENFGSGPTVASYFDETSITAAAGRGAGGIDVRPVDVERIEVLRGPQGTAFGSASLGGALRIIPAKPRLDDFSARLAANYSDTSGHGGGNSMLQGVLNLPLIADKLAVRAVGYRYDESGIYRNTAGLDPVMLEAAESFGVGDFVSGFVQDEVGRIVSTGGRLAALWQATDKLDLSVNFLTQKIEQDGSPGADIGPFEQSRAPVSPQDRVRGEAGDVNDTDMDLVNGVLHYNLGWATLTSAASWVDSGQDNSAGAQRLFVSDFGPISGSTESDFESFSAETRLASQVPGPFQFLGGLFYENVDERSVANGHWPGPPATIPFFLGTNPFLLNDIGRELDQRAVFGEVSYEWTDKLTATVGARYFKYDRDESNLQEGAFAGGVPIGGGTALLLQSSESDTNFKANVSYKPTQDALLYGTWAQGFRLGRPDAGLRPVASTCDADSDGLVDGTSISIESTTIVNSDFLDNYEIGGKFTLFNRRMTVDTAVYHIDWQGVPVNVLVFEGSCIGSYVANVGAATSDGVELQASLFVAQGLRLDFGGSYTRAELSEDQPDLFVPAFEGDRLPGSPKVNANLAAQYDFALAGYKAFVRADSFYAGEFFGDLQESPGLAAGNYVKIDARAGVALKNLSVELFVRNLTNEDAATWRSPSLATFASYRLRPRTVGVLLGYKFD